MIPVLAGFAIILPIDAQFIFLRVCEFNICVLYKSFTSKISVSFN